MVESYADYIHELHYKLQYRQQKASAHTHQGGPVLAPNGPCPTCFRYLSAETQLMALSRSSMFFFRCLVTT